MLIIPVNFFKQLSLLFSTHELYRYIHRKTCSKQFSPVFLINNQSILLESKSSLTILVISLNFNKYDIRNSVK